MSHRPPSYHELAAVIEGCAGVSVDAEALSRQPEVTFEDLGVDSLGVMGVVAALENRYGIRLGTGAEQCQRPDQLRALVEETLRTAASPQTATSTQTTTVTEAADARTH